MYIFECTESLLSRLRFSILRFCMYCDSNQKNGLKVYQNTTEDDDGGYLSPLSNVIKVT